MKQATKNRHQIFVSSVTILDVNDNAPVLNVPPHCVNITEFHEPGQPITIIYASDADDPETSNGQVNIKHI